MAFSIFVLPWTHHRHPDLKLSIFSDWNSAPPMPLPTQEVTILLSVWFVTLSTACKCNQTGFSLSGLAGFI